MTKAPIPCRAVFLDAGGVIVLPDRRAACRRLRARRHPHRPIRGAPRPLPRRPPLSTAPPASAPQRRRGIRARSFPSLELCAGRTAEALAAWDHLAQRSRSRVVLWSEPTPGAIDMIAALSARRARRRRSSRTPTATPRRTSPRAGSRGVPVIDSEVVGAAKPDVRIFEAALACAGEELAALGRSRVAVKPSEVVHVGDTLSADVAGARAAGITPIHLDPLRACRARDHRHIRSLPGLWRHVGPPGTTQTMAPKPTLDDALSSRVPKAALHGSFRRTRGEDFVEW